jgi:hypothetical protein
VFLLIYHMFGRHCVTCSTYSYVHNEQLFIFCQGGRPGGSLTGPRNGHTGVRPSPNTAIGLKHDLLLATRERSALL